MRERLPLLAGLTFIAVAFGLGADSIATGIRDRGRSEVITVTGSAKRAIVSDYIIWGLSVTSQQGTATAASRELTGWTDQIRSFLSGAGASPGEVTAQPIYTETVNAKDGRVIGYKLTRSFEVRSSRVKEIAKLADDSAQLLAEGVPIAAQPLQYVYTRLPSLRPELLAAATKDALGRARVLVESTGAHLGGLRGVDVGVFQVTSPNSTQVSDYGVYDTSTLEKDVTAVVNVTFALK